MEEEQEGIEEEEEEENAGPSIGSVPLEAGVGSMEEDPKTNKRYLTTSGSSTGASRKGQRKKVQTSRFQGIPKKKEMSAKAKGKAVEGTSQINHL